MKYEFKRGTWMQHERRAPSAHVSGEKKTKRTEEVWPHSLKNVDWGEKQEQDCHRQREQLGGKKLNGETDALLSLSEESNVQKNKSVYPKVSLSLGI